MGLVIFTIRKLLEQNELVDRSNSILEHPKRKLEIDICIDKFQAFSGIYCPVFPVELPIKNETISDVRFQRLQTQTLKIWHLFLIGVLQEVGTKFELAN